MTGIDVLSSACLPWRSVDSVDYSFYQKTGGSTVSLKVRCKDQNEAHDTQEMINRCLSCEKSRCNNCLSPKKRATMRGQMRLEGF